MVCKKLCPLVIFSDVGEPVGTEGAKVDVMQVAVDAPKRPALRYYGGKWRLASWIIKYFPPHLSYVEPCSGACSVLLQKPRSPLETINDLDGNVVNFFRVLRDQPDELIRKIALTPWARSEYELSLQPCDNEIEKARRFFSACWLSINGSSAINNPSAKGWHLSIDGLQVTSDYFYKLVPNLEAVAQRLLDVQVDNQDALTAIDRYDGPETLFYFDPPYVEETRTKNDWYGADWNGEQLHIESASLLRQCSGYVVVSGYACPLYTKLYEDHRWHRVDKEAQTNSGGKRIESLWLSPRTWSALNDSYADLPLFV